MRRTEEIPQELPNAGNMCRQGSGKPFPLFRESEVTFFAIRREKLCPFYAEADS
jgi:hypothetical protein